jgi:hypothetical protein
MNICSDVNTYLDNMTEGPPAPCQHLNWDRTGISSNGWSGSITISKHTRKLFVEQIRAPSNWSNELHVIFPGCWRQTQVAAYLDDGTFYLSYGQKVISAPSCPWRNPGSRAGVVVEIDKQSNTAKIHFFNNFQLVSTFFLSGGLHQVSDLLIELRVHPHGAMRII